MKRREVHGLQSQEGRLGSRYLHEMAWLRALALRVILGRVSIKVFGGLLGLLSGCVHRLDPDCGSGYVRVELGVDGRWAGWKHQILCQPDVGGDGML